MIGIGTEGALGPVAAEYGSDATSGRTQREASTMPPAGAGSGAPSDERAALAVLVSVEGLGPMTLARLVDTAGSAAAVIDIALAPGGASAIVDLSGDAAWEGRRLDASVAGAIVGAAPDRDHVIERLAATGIEVIALADPAYPPRLRAIALPPHVLFVRGNPGAMSSEHTIAVVGTRRPTVAGRALAARLARSLVRAGASVVSGLAVGVDGAAHDATVGAGGVTVAVIGSGHDRLYPAAHGRLAAAIVASGGAVVSEFAPRVHATQGTFPRRNRLISGLSEATIVVEAPARSGALTTAAWALEQGRGCYLVPGGLDAPMSAGCLAFLREAGAEARIVAGIPELLDDLGLAAAAGLETPHGAGGRSTVRRPGSWRSRGASRESVLQSLDPTPRAIARALIAGATTVDQLVAVTDLPVAAVLGALTRLESADLVVGAYGRYVPAVGLSS